MAKTTAATGLLRATDVEHMWLPLSHVFGKALTSTHIEVGHVVTVDGRAERIIENLPVVRPTNMAADREITPSPKVKRPVVERPYRDLLDETHRGTREA